MSRPWQRRYRRLAFLPAGAGAGWRGTHRAGRAAILVVHGVLHLLGHDHGIEAEKEKMWALQAKVLIRLGSAISSPPP
jgi:probable rRNA maturation factor